MIVCLNVITSEQSWMGSHEEMLEMLVKTAASFVYHGFQQNYAVGLVSNGCLAHADHPFHILPSRSHDQLATLLTALAGTAKCLRLTTM